MRNGDLPASKLAFLLHHSPGIGRVGLATLLYRLQREEVSAGEFLCLSDEALLGRYKLKAETVHALRNPSDSASETWDQLQEKQITVLAIGNPSYPSCLIEKLGQATPPVLYVFGNQQLLCKISVGFCGSRKASEKGLSVTDACARLLASEGINVVSGYAHGVDLAAHRGALEGGGSTTIVLAEGIFRYRIKEQLRLAQTPSDVDQVLVISEFHPMLPWKAHNAMTRNRTICGLSNALVVIESGLEGGTFEAGKTALELGEPLFCVEYEEPSMSAAGNSYFLEHGAVPLRRSRSGEPNLIKLLSAVRGQPFYSMGPHGADLNLKTP
jgi:DNA processing protein